MTESVCYATDDFVSATDLRRIMKNVRGQNKQGLDFYVEVDDSGTDPVRPFRVKLFGPARIKFRRELVQRWVRE